MADTFTLPADANNLNVSFSFPKEARPYLQAWFDQTKQDGETVNDFAIRVVMEKALGHRMERILLQIATESASDKQDHRDDRNSLLDDHTAVLDTLSNLL